MNLRIKIVSTILSLLIVSKLFPSTIIGYNIPKESYGSLKIYDISGREIRTLINEKKHKGDYKIEFQRRGLRNGTYL